MVWEDGGGDPASYPMCPEYARSAFTGSSPQAARGQLLREALPCTESMRRGKFAGNQRSDTGTRPMPSHLRAGFTPVSMSALAAAIAGGLSFVQPVNDLSCACNPGLPY